SLGAQAQNDVLLTNSRHKACLDSALLSVRKAREALHDGITWDIIASLVRGSLDALAELTGDAVSDTLVDTIFSRFCVGK
ncbi:MAG: tRNA uridine-5-carboxymethylaminomethyl(34) synthesis GTPase MnmE, partial [Eubacteriales bacterium]|nr:tRNA uridine-5-carboxymethylaminomethyl(34) synthesis GTPase MnmE [Eubacteriales bacterium]